MKHIIADGSTQEHYENLLAWLRWCARTCLDLYGQFPTHMVINKWHGRDLKGMTGFCMLKPTPVNPLIFELSLDAIPTTFQRYYIEILSGIVDIGEVYCILEQRGKLACIEVLNWQEWRNKK